MGHFSAKQYSSIETEIEQFNVMLLYDKADWTVYCDKCQVKVNKGFCSLEYQKLLYLQQQHTACQSCAVCMHFL